MIIATTETGATMMRDMATLVIILRRNLLDHPGRTQDLPVVGAVRLWSLLMIRAMGTTGGRHLVTMVAGALRGSLPRKGIE